MSKGISHGNYKGISKGMSEGMSKGMCVCLEGVDRGGPGRGVVNFLFGVGPRCGLVFKQRIQ